MSSFWSTYWRFFLANGYMLAMNLLSPVQRHTNATALGNLIVSSVLKSLVLVPSAFVVWLSWPNHTEPSETVSWTTTPES